ncbi:hypothetical protein [Lederbergia panacisoli]|uniref:hypothetical protein n=1 Tax=Lederbergia panacisoli TaxID=1255251 RepID=UPI00214B6717|nr:hypothetical protein [Lederbergia panacisoli]MCR2823567.1 hypothetical protein [Lederbergia panacisoli]
MKEGKVIKFPEMKIVDNDFEVDFGVEVIRNKADYIDSKERGIQDGIDEVNGILSSNNKRLEELNKEIDGLTNHSDGIDYMVAVGSGILAGIIDSLWVGEFKMERGKAWSNKTVNDFVMKVAKMNGFEGERLDDAIRFLENKFHIPSDNIWKGKDIGISARSHHLDDLAHHPTPIGLFFSILTQFTKKGYFQNSEGQFLPITIDENGEGLIGQNIPSKIFAGTVNWFFHLVSDISGSYKTAGAGMGIPGPIVSLLKELSMIPGLNKTELPKKMKEIFVREKFDLRSELAVGYELSRQAMPVILNEVIVRAFYFIRRLVMEIKEKQSFKKIDWKRTLPWKNRTIVRMLTISTGTFTLIDLGDAAIRGGIKSGGNPAMFAKEFILRVNFVGVGRFAIAVTTDATMGMKRDKIRNERMSIFSEQLHLMNAKVYYLQADAWVAAKTAEKTINEAVKMMEETTKISIEAWKANRQSMDSIGKYKLGIENHNAGLIEDINDILKWG